MNKSNKLFIGSMTALVLSFVCAYFSDIVRDGNFNDILQFVAIISMLFSLVAMAASFITMK